MADGPWKDWVSSELTNASTLTGTEEWSAVQGGASRAVSPAQIKTYVHTGAQNYDVTIITPGTTGDATINKPAGIVNFGPGDADLTVTNSLVTANSMIRVEQQAPDGTMTRAWVMSKTSGSFVISGDSPPTNETPVAFWVNN